jgi:hypothetical protein
MIQIMTGVMKGKLVENKSSLIKFVCSSVHVMF